MTDSFQRGQLHRRTFLTQSAAAAAMCANAHAVVAADDAPTIIDVGSRRELFVDDYLIERLAGKARQRLHHPVPQQIALDHDEPWEGTGSGYHSVFQDGDLYRMYYKAWHLEVANGKLNTGRASVVLLLRGKSRWYPFGPSQNLGCMSFRDPSKTTSRWSAESWDD